MRIRLLAAAAVAWSVSTIATPSLAAEPDAATLDRGSEIAYRRTLAAAANDRRLNADPNVAVRIRRVANRVVAAAAAFEPASRRYAWAVNVVSDPAADVRLYPGGRVVVHQGLVARTGLSDEELAAIVAHAVAHALLGHDQRRIATRLGAANASADPNQAALDAAQATEDALRRLRYTPVEIEAADRASVELLARAAYDPRAAGSAWRRLALGDRGVVERAPVDDARLVALDAAARAATGLYDEARAKAEAQATRSRQPLITGPGSRGGPPIR